jgi:RHS repeat-associated protein
MPFGDEITSTSNDREKFATYTRDSYTGLDYADQRFYASTYGRFLTPDPARKSARLRNPQSWNRYSYALGDPVNRFDPRGTCDQTTYSGSIDADGNWTISVDCADYPAWSWGDLFTGFWESLSGPSYSNGTPCYICLRQAAAEMQDVPFGDPVYAAQVVQAVNGLNAGGFLNAFMVFSTATGLGAADIVGAANAFAAGEAGAHAIVLGTSTNLAAGTSGYVEIGGVLGAETLSMTPAQWAALGTEGQEAAMAGFIDGAIQRGAQIIFTSDPSLAAAAGNVGTAFEYSYLTDTLGYNIVQQGTSWVAVAP